jgi:excinuclease ABC subunit C
MQCAVSILRGNTREAINALTEQMYAHAENERFEDAARCRDGIEAMKRLGEGQKVVGAPDDEYDVIAVYSDDTCTCVSVFYIRSGLISDSESFAFGASEINVDDEYEYMTSFLTDLYSRREYIPSQILLSFDFPECERALVEEYLRKMSGRAINVKIPQKGNSKKLCEMVHLNAKQQAMQYREKHERDTKTLFKLGNMLGLDAIPERIEAYDISNLGNEHITAGMIVFENGKLSKDDYRVFKIKNQDGADDYSAMREVLLRRVSHLQDEKGSFSKMPDLILLDGGMTHVGVAKKLFEELGVNIPVFGMVKDEHHKTRTIVTDEEEISIAKEQSVFIFVYKLQEEVHRFTVSKMDFSKRKTLKTSSLEKIQGIGKEKAKRLLAHFKTISAIKKAQIEEILAVKGISDADAKNIYDYFNKD